jgi:hypothetical protein
VALSNPRLDPGFRETLEMVTGDMTFRTDGEQRDAEPGGRPPPPLSDGRGLPGADQSASAGTFALRSATMSFCTDWGTAW